MNNQYATKPPLWWRCLVQLLAVVLALYGLQYNMVFAQQAVQDIEAPVLEHDQIKIGNLGETQVFTVNAVDNIALESVSLFYRFTGDEQFEKVAMQPIAGSAFFSANVSNDRLPDAETSIEYYLQASDTAGNVVLKGYIFDPMTRVLLASPVKTDAPADSLVDATVAEPSQGDQPAQPPEQKKSNTWYYVLGAVGLIALAALAGGGGSGDDGPGEPDCGPEGCQVNLVVNPP